MSLKSVDVERSSSSSREKGKKKTCRSPKNTEGMQECEQAGEEEEGVRVPHTMLSGCQLGTVLEMFLL